MTLSELRQRSGSASHKGGYGDDPQGTAGHITSSTSYARPIDALYKGRPVRLVAFGDITGMSPAEKFVDENGKFDWVSSDDNDLVVNDQNIVPRSADQQQRLNKQLTGSSR